MTIPALVAVAVSGCSDPGREDRESAVMSSAVAASTAAAASEAAGDTEGGGVVRILLGETKAVPVPADSVLDIRMPVAWGAAAEGVRCVVTESSGRNEDLRSSDVKKTENAGGAEWMTVWTFSSTPAGEVTIACADPESRVMATHSKPYVRVVPRPVVPLPSPGPR